MTILRSYAENMHLPGLSVPKTSLHGVYVVKMGFAGTIKKVHIDQDSFHFLFDGPGRTLGPVFMKSDFDVTPGMLYDCILNALETTGHTLTSPVL